jgi:glycosyltransferase involved in cell wall biosynthesis
MKVLFVIGRLDRGGAERQLLLTARGLKNFGWDVAIVELDGRGDLASEAIASGMPVLSPHNRSRTDVLCLRFLRKQIKAFKPDVVYPFLPRQHGITTFICATIRRHRPRLVWGLRAAKVNWRAQGRNSQFAFSLVSKVSGRADLYIANSRAVAEYHLSIGYSADKMKIVRNAIDPDVFYPDPESGESIRRDLGLRADQSIVGTLTRFDPTKRNEDFLLIAAEIAQQNPDTRFVVVGPHTEEQGLRYQNLARELNIGDNVILRPKTDTPQKILNAFDVFVLTSETEGSPNVVYEALACGVPVVATDVGDLRHENIKGLLTFQVGNISESSRAILDQLHQRGDLAKAWKRHVDVQLAFAPQAQIDQTITALTSTIAESRRRES